jgi:hypothetical protein
MKNRIFNYPLISCIIILMFSAVQAQTTVFIFQGRLTDSTMPANGDYQMEFRLFSANGTEPLASTTDNPVSVTNNLFTARLIFPEAVYDGAPRFLEIRVRRNDTENYVTLADRQPLYSVPYVVRARKAQTAETVNNTSQIDGIGLGGLFREGDSRLTDSRFPRAGSSYYIQNQFSSVQLLATFNISEGGTADVFNARTQLSLGDQQILSVAGTGNVFLGKNSGNANLSGAENTFAGEDAGKSNTDGSGNSFLGYSSGANNTDGSGNSFLGMLAGSANISGSQNSFFGYASGLTSQGKGNSFFGNLSGFQNTTGSNNSFLGNSAGAFNSTGSNNVSIGHSAGLFSGAGNSNVYIGANSSNNVDGGNFNTMIGIAAGSGTNTPLNYATAIGASSQVFTSNTIAFGRADGTDRVRLNGIGEGGETRLCRNSENVITACSSSLRYKTNIASFSDGLSFVNQLRPVSFDWKEGGMKDVGFIAEEVALIDPKFIVYNAAGEIEGLKYNRLSVVFVNAFKEQQTRLEAQRKELEDQKTMVESLLKLSCANNAKTEGCQ